jgi:uncharacterized protein YneF (UPF0154 family)
MNRALYIIGIVCAVIFFFVTGFYIAETVDAGFNSIMRYDDPYMSYYGVGRAEVTEEAAIVSIFFFILFMVIDLLGLIKVKTKTMKVMAILGLSFSGLFLIWNFAVLSSPGSMSFDEVGLAWLLYCMIMLAFSIVGLVQSAKYSKRLKQGAAGVNPTESDLLDS